METLSLGQCGSMWHIVLQRGQIGGPQPLAGVNFATLAQADCSQQDQKGWGAIAMSSTQHLIAEKEMIN